MPYKMKPISEVYNMDCLEYMRSLPDKHFDLCIADPPYGINRGGQTKTICKNPKHNRKHFTKKDWDTDVPSEQIFHELFRVSKNQVIWGANYFTKHLPKSMGWIVWDKGQHGLSMSDGELAFTSFERALRINTINRSALAREGTIHPTQKPIDLYAWILKNYAKQGDKIFDPFLGSGSSRIAAFKKGFDFYACELDKEYFDAQEERFQKECFGVEKLANGKNNNTAIFILMFDKVIIKGRIDTADIDSIVLRNYLEQCTEGDEVFYRSTAYANFDGCVIEVRGNAIKCRCSINKLFYKDKSGKLDNSKPMTFRNAVRTINALLLRLFLKPENAIITYYELGLTLKLSHPAIDYINAVSDISERILWNDANYPINRQKTTEKSKYYRKILKIYDKTFEAKEKGREVGNNILRIETIYRHQSIKLLDLIDPANLHKIGKIFYEDWLNIRFARELIPLPGVKMSQLDKAREIQRIGVTRYKERYKTMYQEKKITKKQWETIRNFARAWPIERERYKEEPTELEIEYKDKLLSAYQIGSITPFSKTM